MKKILAILLVCFITLSFFACDSGEESSAPAIDNESTDSSDVDDDASVTKEDLSDEASSDAFDVSDNSLGDSVSDISDDESDEVSDIFDVSVNTSEDTSEDTSEESEPEDDNVVFTNKFVSWGLAANANRTNLKATDATSINISRINEAKLLPGEIALFTSDYDIVIPTELDYTDFAIAVFEYKASVYSYVKKSVSKIGEGSSSTAIPKDGYVLVIHKDYKAKIDAISKTAKDTIFFPHGFVANNGLNTTIKKKTATVDGKISSSEYGKAVWTFENENPLVSYAQFNGDIYAEAEVYLTYDKTNLYVGVIVSTPYHQNTLTASTADQLWAYDSIQVNLSSEVYGSEYMDANWDNHNGGKAGTDKVVKQYGFGCNKENETLSYVWMPWQGKTESTAVVKRDESAQKTYYEIAIPLAEFGTEDHPAGDKIGFSISINCGDGKVFKNIVLRDGGGIIGINDFSKIPVITLG